MNQFAPFGYDVVDQGRLVRLWMMQETEEKTV